MCLFVEERPISLVSVIFSSCPVIPKKGAYQPWLLTLASEQTEQAKGLFQLVLAHQHRSASFEAQSQALRPNKPKRRLRETIPVAYLSLIMKSEEAQEEARHEEGDNWEDER